MNSCRATVHSLPESRCSEFRLQATFVLVLLLCVPILATLARNSWYLPPSNPGHYLMEASKAEIVISPIAFSLAVVPLIAGMLPPREQTQRIHIVEVVPYVPLMTLAAPLRRRPPPSCLP